MYDKRDTITAQATVSGEGGIAIIRISGTKSKSILEKVFHAASGDISPRRLSYGHIVWEGETIDEVMAVYFPGPHTYTMEDMAEIQCHGSQYIVMRIIDLLIKCGVRLAEPGEFTYRAFENGRIDLTQAEAVVRLIQSSNERSRKSAIRQMDGAVSEVIHKIQSQMLDISAELSAFIDFPDEIDEIETTQEIRKKCLSLCNVLLGECNIKKGRIEDEGLFIVLYGKPNAGKSSLLNTIVGKERAIVTDIPGTTRDIIRDTVMIDGIRFTFVDTAGIRETDNAVERIGVERAYKAIETADIRILLIDSSEKPGEELHKLIAGTQPDLIIMSKDDISREDTKNEITGQVEGIPLIQISTILGNGVNELKTWLVNYAESDLAKDCAFTQTRHIEIAEKAAGYLRDAISAIDCGMPLDMINVDLMSAMNTIGEITGENVSEAIIDRVFSQFCVGK